MASYELRGLVSGHDGQTYNVGESTNNQVRHMQNIRHYANRENFKSWKLQEVVFGENGNVAAITELSNN